LVGTRLTSLSRWRPGRKIFVSYRRSDTQETAELLYPRLSKHFGPSNVFMDRADIEHGQRWRDEVEAQIAAADMFVALIGPTWLETLRMRSGGDDVLRTELHSALEQKKQLIPVLVDGAVMPETRDLPPELRGLAEYQALILTRETVDRAIRSLLGRIKPGWRLAASWGLGQLLGWMLGLLILISALAFYGWMEGGGAVAFADDYPFVAGAFAGALAGLCVSAPQWLVLRPWFARARYLPVVYVALAALAAGLAGSVRQNEGSEMVLGFVVMLLPIALTCSLWWVVSEQLVYAGWWSTANLLSPIFGLLVAAALNSDPSAAGQDASDSSIAAGLSVLADFLVPMIVTSLATGALLVWLMRRSEIRQS
jgi:hypothetical protein